MALSSFALAGATAITALHPDIIETHIISRLDGASLASAATSSPFLHELCTEEKIWDQICTSTWNSVSDLRVRHAISTFPTGHRLFFSDSFPTLVHSFQSGNLGRRQLPSELISAVDIMYKGKSLFSKVVVTETVTERFACTPLWLDLLDSKETIPTPLKFEGDEDEFLSDLESHLTVSWILIDPTLKRSVNVSSIRPVLARRQWMTGEAQLRYATNLAGAKNEHVQLRIGVTCVGVEGDEVQISDVNLQLQDIEGMFLKGRDSLVILQDAMEFGVRKKRGGEKERYEQFLCMKREKRVKKIIKEKNMNLVFGVLRFSLFLGFVSAFIWEKFFVSHHS